MSPRDLSQRRLLEVQQLLKDHRPTDPNADLDLLAGLCSAVLASIDARDLGSTPSQALLQQMEAIAAVISTRRPLEPRVDVQAAGESGIVLTTNLEDQPFIVSSIRALLEAEDLEIRQSLNAIVNVRRDPLGRALQFGGGVGSPESIVRMSLRVPAGFDAAAFTTKVFARLRLAQAMVRDFDAIRRQLELAADEHRNAASRAKDGGAVHLETEALLRWLGNDNFVFFSVEDYGRDAQVGRALGAASVQASARDVDLVRAAVAGEGGEQVRFRRSSEDSPVHRAGKPVQFYITRSDADGHAAGALVIDGLFTYKALHLPPEEIPSLRVVLRALLADRDVKGDSHRGKAITNAFNSLPLEYLLTARREEVWALTDRVLRAEEEGESDVELRVADDRRWAFVLVSLPKSEYSEELRLQVQSLLMQRLTANYADHGVYLDRYENALVYFYLTAADSIPAFDVEGLRGEILSLARGWEERLREALSSLGDAEAVEDLYAVYEHAFTEEHRRRAAIERLRGDIICLENIRSGRLRLDCDLFVSSTGDHPGSVNLRVFTRDPIALSTELPVIVNFGFEVVDSYTRECRLPQHAVELHNFRFNVRLARQAQVMSRREEINQALRDVFAGRLGDDSLNRLVAATSMSGRDVQILRALLAYVHQLRSAFTDELVQKTLVEYPTVSQAMLNLLAARFDPALDGVDERVAADALTAELRAVRDYTADRVLSLVAEVVRAIVRTNAFGVVPGDDKPMAFKIASRQLSIGPEPKPFREIWVYHPDFEGVHLRGGSVARGGLRYSDRNDDFRTEIHDLMSTQMVKNVVIVPVGAKGGFIVRNPPTDRAAYRAIGDLTYAKFVRALLSVTDNVVGGATVTPAGIRQTEGHDPYLVVAADKGTAHMSDTANGISMEQGFWMDDAFASGGSNGYDHKATGITARGAWESALRNCRELGIDLTKDEITAIGVGDMSGDVFGNGLLRSDKIRLLAAFNHVHVFVDPSPDAARSFVERQRLFEKPGSMWTDYDPAVLSTGGGVFDRKAKEIALSPEARAMLGLSVDAPISGEEAIRAILRMQADLCWMGGIGTYVKATSESHADVGDKANDAVRIDARELRCRVFAEGANLSITERGRTEFARNGGSGYTAFLDNSGGVDLSDHEVNIKLLFAPLLRSGKVTREARNKLLRDMEDRVVELVLSDNRSQSRMVSFDVVRSKQDPWRYSRTLHHLADAVPFSPESFSMPTDEELASRARKGLGLFKPEAAVLGSHAKMLAYRELLAGEALPAELARTLVLAYFPAEVVALAGEDAVGTHLLHRELASTMLVNQIVDDAGATFFSEVVASTGRSFRDVAVAYRTARDTADADGLLHQLYGLEDGQRQTAVYHAMAAAQTALERATHDILDMPRIVFEARELETARALLADVVACLPDHGRRALEAKTSELVSLGIPADLAIRINDLRWLGEVLDAVELGRERGVDPRTLLRLRLEVVSRLGFVELEQALESMRLDSPFDGPALFALARQLDFHANKATRLAAETSVEEVFRRYDLDRVRHTVAEQLRGGISVAGIVLLDSGLRRTLPPKTLG
jgi:glutamate dehydrogenase